jgi:plasmid stability protein
MPTSITIRDIPDDARDALAARAALSGRSLQGYLRAELIELARRPSAEALMARIRERKRAAGTRVAGETILEHLDAGRR